MEIVITHLSRMTPNTVFAAGLNLSTNRLVRPVPSTGFFHSRVVTTYGGPFDIGTVINVRPVRYLGTAPHFENLEVDPTCVRQIDQIEPRKYWAMLRNRSKPTLTELFGSELKLRGKDKAATAQGRGMAGLGILRLTNSAELLITPNEQLSDIRLYLQTPDFEWLNIAVLDVRLYDRDGEKPDPGIVDRITKRIRGGEGVLLSVGLTRAFAGRIGFEPVHWLAVQNIHLENDPTWRLVPHTRRLMNTGA